MGRVGAGAVLALVLLAGCGAKDADRPQGAESEDALPPDDRGSHQGRPAASFRQMGIDSLTPATVRRLVNIAREPVITVAYRRTGGREITSCRGDSQILEESTLNGGRFTVMCTAASGAQRPMHVGTAER